MDMGIGRLGFSNLTFKRKFRFTFELFTQCGTAINKIPRDFVKLAARPSITIEETEINFLNAKLFIPGKATWETMTVTYLDASDEALVHLYSWLASIYNFLPNTGSGTGTDPAGPTVENSRSKQASKAIDYAATGIISLWDGCGGLMETWTLENVWPSAVNFGDLDYSSSDIAEIELTLRYQNASYVNYCPGFVPVSCCTPCS